MHDSRILKAPSRLDPADLRKRAAGRIDVNARHKPASIVRQEAKRAVEQFLDLEAPALPRAERDQIVEDVLSDVLGYGPLDRLFPDERHAEFMALTHDRLIARDGDSWRPLNVRFRDPAQYRTVLDRIAAQGEPVAADGAKAGSSFDVKLPNGFRVVGVLPPAVLDHPPMAVFTRVGKPAKPTGRSGPVPAVDFNLPSRPDPDPTASSMRMLDPFEQYRNRITAKLIGRLAAAGVYDLSALPMNELSRAVAMYVQEFNTEERLGLDKASEDRLTLDILVAMKRG